MHPWYRLLYTVALAIAVARSLKYWRVVPFWLSMLSACLVAAVYGASPSFVLAIAVLRALAAVEAFARLTLHRVWLPGAHLVGASWLLAAGATFGMRMFAPGPVDALVFRRYLSIWDGLWLLFALLFFATWGDTSTRKWRHALLVMGLVWVEAAGALIKLSGAGDSGWWLADRCLYLMAAAIVLAWAFIAPRQLQGARSYLSGDLGCREAAFLAPGPGR